MRVRVPPRVFGPSPRARVAAPPPESSRTPVRTLYVARRGTTTWHESLARARARSEYSRLILRSQPSQRNKPAASVFPGQVPSILDGSFRAEISDWAEPASAEPAAAPAVRRALGRPHPSGRDAGLRSTGKAIRRAAARLLPPSPRLARGCRGCPAGGLRRRVQCDAGRRPPNQCAAVALPNRPQSQPQPSEADAVDRRGLDGRAPLRPRCDDRRQGSRA